MIRWFTFLIILLPSIAWGGLDMTPEEISFLAEHPTIHTSFTEDQPPLEFYQEGCPAGFIIDYLEHLAEFVGFEINFGERPNLWKNIDEDFSNWDIDLITGTITSKHYSDYALLTDPYLYFQRVFVVRKYAAEVSTPADLGGGTVAATKGLFFIDVWKRKYPDLNWLMVDTTEEMVLAVADGRADAAYTLKSTVDYFATQHALINLRSDVVPSGMDGLENCFRIAVRSDWPELHSLLNKAIEALPMETRNKLWNKWLGSQAPESELRFTEAEQRFIREHPILRYSMLPDAPPIEYRNDEGEYVGLTRQYLQVIEQKTGIQLEPVPSKDRAEKLQNLRSKRVDFLPTYSPYDVPDSTLLQTDTYMDFPLVIATRTNVPYISSLSNISNRRIGLVARIGILSDYRLRFPDLEFVACATVLDGLQKLSQGELFGVIGPQPVVAHQIQELYMGNLKITGVLNDSLGLCALVRDADEPLLGILNKVLRSITPEDREEMLNQWLSIRFEHGFDYQLFWKLLAGAVLVIVLVLTRSQMMARYNRKLQALNDELKHSLEERDRVMSVISHDLRQPVHGYNRFLSLLQQGEVDPTSEAGQRILHQARHLGEQAIECMENLLASLSARRHVSRVVSVSPFRLIEDCRELLAASLENKGLTLENQMDPELRILADEQRLAMVLRNLLNNAIKFSNKGSAIEAGSEKLEGGLRVTISDHGMGMEPAQIHKVLHGDPIEAQKGTLGERGSGMGLKLCRQFLQAIGSDLLFESELGQGTSVSFVIGDQTARTDC